MADNSTLYDIHIQTACQIQFQKDLATHKQAERLKKKKISQGRQQINSMYEKKINQLRMQKKIKRSSFINEQRMKVSRVKYELCEQIFKQVLRRLAKMSLQADLDYQLILVNYAVQACIGMFQQNVKIKVLKRDVQLIKAVQVDIKKSISQFMQQQMGYNFQLDIKILQNDCLQQRGDKKQLSKNQQDRYTIGGIVLTDTTGNIVYKNTFDARVNILKEISLPLIREMLWNKDKELKVT